MYGRSVTIASTMAAMKVATQGTLPHYFTQRVFLDKVVLYETVGF